MTDGIITFITPVEVNDKLYTSLTLNNLKAKHLKHIPDRIYNLSDDYGEFDEEGNLKLDENENPIINIPTEISMKLAYECIPLIASMANLPVTVIEELGIDDLMEVVNKLGPFLLTSQRIGKK